MITIADIFIANAWAQDAAPNPGSSIDSLLFQLFIIFLIFYLLLIRPQQKKVKEHQMLVEGLKRGDKVITAGGIVGTVAKVNSDNKTVDVKIASGVEVSVIKGTITDVTDKKSDDKKTNNDNTNTKKKKK